MSRDGPGVPRWRLSRLGLAARMMSAIGTLRPAGHGGQAGGGKGGGNAPMQEIVMARKPADNPVSGSGNSCVNGFCSRRIKKPRPRGRGNVVRQFFRFRRLRFGRRVLSQPEIDGGARSDHGSLSWAARFTALRLGNVEINRPTPFVFSRTRSNLISNSVVLHGDLLSGPFGSWY